MSVDYGGSGGDGDNVDNPYDGDDGSTDDGTSDSDGTNGGSGGDGGVSGSDLWSSVDVLTALVNNPQGFVVGAVLTTILEAVTGAVTTAVDQIILLVGGSQPTRFNAPGETLGLADVPVAAASTLTSAGDLGGQAILDGIEAFNATLFDAAAAAGPFAPFVVIVIASVEAVVVVLVLRRVVFLVADWLQLGGLTE